MILDKFADNPLLSLAWVGSSIGAVDLGVTMMELVDTLPSEQLLGSGVAEILVPAYIAAGSVSIAADIARGVDQ